MKTTSILLSIFILLSLIAGQVAENGTINAADIPQARPESVSDQVIVNFSPEVNTARMQEIYNILGATIAKDIPQINAHVINIAQDKVPLLNTFREIVSVEPDYVVKAEAIPDDTNFSQQWGLTKIQASKAWDATHGGNTIKIAVLDSGIDSSHIDLAAKVAVKQNFSDSSTSEDVFGHGTHVAGIAAAVTNNSAGVAGVGYNASLMNVKVLTDSGAGSYSAIVQGIIWAADNGANVINLSMGADIDSAAMKQSIDYAWNKGVVVVAAAGNNGNSKPAYPAYYDNCIAVAATDPDDKLYSFSNYGSWLDVSAPGSTISTLPGNKYGTMGGTSMASPFVAGLAALAFAVAKDTNSDGKRNDEVRAAIESGADNIGVANIGKGRINAYNTISKLVSATNPPPSTPTQPVRVPPTLTTSAVGNVTTNSVVLNGNLTGLGSVTAVQTSFQYGTTTSYGYTTNAQSKTTIGTFSSSIAGLSPNTIYHFRSVAVGTTTVYGSDQTFTTARVPSTTSAPTPTLAPIPSVAPGPVTKNFGLNIGDSVWTSYAGSLNAMRFQNSAQTGRVTKLELLFNTPTPSGKVRMGVYADNNGAPGNLIAEAGETTVTNGWVSISGLSIPVNLNGYYWLAFNLQNANGVSFLSSSANTSKTAHSWTNSSYGTMPGTFNTSDSNLGPYIMRAMVTSP